MHGKRRDIFDRLYAVRLDQLRKLPEAQTHWLNLTRLESIFHRLVDDNYRGGGGALTHQFCYR